MERCRCSPECTYPGRSEAARRVGESGENHRDSEERLSGLKRERLAQPAAVCRRTISSVKAAELLRRCCSETCAATVSASSCSTSLHLDLACSEIWESVDARPDRAEANRHAYARGNELAQARVEPGCPA